MPIPLCGEPSKANQARMPSRQSRKATGDRLQATGTSVVAGHRVSVACSLWPVAPVNIRAKNAEVMTKESNTIAGENQGKRAARSMKRRTWRGRRVRLLRFDCGQRLRIRSRANIKSSTSTLPSLLRSARRALGTDDVSFPSLLRMKMRSRMFTKPSRFGSPGRYS